MERPGAYVVVLRPDLHMAAVRVRDVYHLPGGGIDNGETPGQAATREVSEETGLTVVALRFLGRANQFYPHTRTGPMNKLGWMFLGRVGTQKGRKIEDDHHLVWMPMAAFIALPAAGFQKWAVQEATLYV